MNSKLPINLINLLRQRTVAVLARVALVVAERVAAVGPVAQG